MTLYSDALLEAMSRRKAIVVRGASRSIASFPTLAQVEALAKELYAAESPDLSFYKHGNALTFTAGGDSNILSSVIEAALSSGASIVINHVESSWESIAMSLEALRRRIRETCEWQMMGGGNANLYVTPPRMQGFDIHYDRDDVVIVQTAGEKAWDIYAQLTDSPTNATGGFAPEALQLAFQCVLAPGDQLYLPRGTPHKAQSVELTSVHVTMTIPIFQIRHLIEAFALSAADIGYQALGRSDTEVFKECCNALTGLDWADFVERCGLGEMH